MEQVRHRAAENPAKDGKPKAHCKHTPALGAAYLLLLSGHRGQDNDGVVLA